MLCIGFAILNLITMSWDVNKEATSSSLLPCSITVAKVRERKIEKNHCLSTLTLEAAINFLLLLFIPG